ncbi:type II toxin-antitoxin system RelE/ParE family toxin [Bifidobacterium callimiconis]|nr:type II toxin-antitoxin system RelE/ParE family toxin [Bifidobacterium callimiconis]MBT1176933.1 type II toxin-antitoxin system RelE/ParE family toxin [Bifidobacterium callimiconis]
MKTLYSRRRQRWVVRLELIGDWLLSLDEETYAQVMASLEILGERGPMLGRPLVDSIRYSSIHNLKELRPSSSGISEIRMLFAFDPERRAVMLVAGDKRGKWDAWYKTNIPLAEQRWNTYMEERNEADDHR